MKAMYLNTVFTRGREGTTQSSQPSPCALAMQIQPRYTNWMNNTLSTWSYLKQWMKHNHKNTKCHLLCNFHLPNQGTWRNSHSVDWIESPCYWKQCCNNISDRVKRTEGRWWGNRGQEAACVTFFLVFHMCSFGGTQNKVWRNRNGLYSILSPWTCTVRFSWPRLLVKGEWFAQGRLRVSNDLRTREKFRAIKNNVFPTKKLCMKQIPTALLDLKR